MLLELTRGISGAFSIQLLTTSIRNIAWNYPGAAREYFQLNAEGNPERNDAWN